MLDVHGFPFQQSAASSNENGFMQFVAEILTKPFVGVIDMLNGLLKFLREKLRPNDKPMQDVLQQAQEMLNQAMDNAMIKEIQKFKLNEMLEKPKSNANSVPNILETALSA